MYSTYRMVAVDRLMPPHKVTHPDKMIDLANDFVVNGWDASKSILIGYRLNDHIQLLSGSHRLAAAKMAGLLRIPVHVHQTETILELWGTSKWSSIMAP